ncbi:hypothetical protein [Arthrobacter sp. H5]|uniref:hypothetical protein n=1 Tax=Arthrobacter sp. H5 TaxID=1267973 RepID=UPI0004B41227|nr:hypothetical protein [Arthrobacter sp. H5]
MDKNTELLQKILDKLDAIDSSVVSIQNDVEAIADREKSGGAIKAALPHNHAD